MKKVLFITYYWLPSGKASLHWPLKIIKHLPNFGWQPIILTVDKDRFSHKDDSFVDDVSPNLKIIRAKSYEPFNIYKKFTGKKSTDQLVASETISKSNKSFAHRFSIWLRMNMFIPDARIGWYFPAIKSGKTLFQKEKIDAIVSIGPPHTTHLIGRKLSSKFNVPFVPVFIDPWVDIAYYQDFKRSRITLAIDNKLEKSVMRNSKAIVFVTETMRKDYQQKYDFIRDKSHVLYWGYSEEEFKESEILDEKNEEKVIVHAGNIFSFQNPINFWQYLKTEIDNGQKFKLKFIGTVDPVIKESIKINGLENYTVYMGFLTYRKMLGEICNADYLLVCATEPRHVPGKLFEYLRSSKPIIAFGNNNEEVKNILKEANAGMMLSYKENCDSLFSKYDSFKTDKEYVEGFERQVIAEKMRELLDKLV